MGELVKKEKQMESFSRAHKGRLAIRAFKVIADAMVIRGNYKPSGTSGQALETVSYTHLTLPTNREV